MLPDLVKTMNEQSLAQGQVAINEVTSVHTLSDLMNTCGFGKSMFCKVEKLLAISNCTHDICLSRMYLFRSSKDTCNHVSNSI